MLHAVILAGGSGTRFWPSSRRDRPKQLLSLAGSATLLEQTYERIAGLSESAVVVTSEDLAPGVREQLPEVELLLEPERRDTAAAIGLAAGVLSARDPEAVLVATPADHVVRPASRFQRALREAAALAQESGAIVTFGIPPQSPHTGYGYIERGAERRHEGRLSANEVVRFREKPDQKTAAGYLEAGTFLWNSGVFVATGKTFMGELARSLPDHHSAIQRIVAAWGSPDQERVLREEYGKVEKISIDYGVMERAERVLVLEVDYEWSDVGSWAAIPPLHEADEEGNVALDAPVVTLDSRDCLVQGDGRLVTLIGLEGLVVVQTRDATLICPRERAEEVKQLVVRLEERGLDDYV